MSGRTTDEHPFHSADTGEWLRADELVVGDRLSAIRGDATLLAITYSAQRVPVYNLSIPGSPTYFVGDGGVWVHNCTPPSPKLLNGGRADRLAKKHGYEGAEDLKEGYVDGPVSHWDMYTDNQTGTIWLGKKDGSSWINTELKK
jgi:hypothetical protein